MYPIMGIPLKPILVGGFKPFKPSEKYDFVSWDDLSHFFSWDNLTNLSTLL